MASRALRLGKRLVFPPTMCGNNSAVQGKNSVVAWKLACVGRKERTGSMPTSISDDEKRVRCYLLKLASEEELDLIEETFLATSEHAELINDVERRLISDYVERRLSEQEKVAFERNYLVTNERREQLTIAQALS